VKAVFGLVFVLVGLRCVSFSSKVRGRVETVSIDGDVSFL
jgi:hypothetical protein